MKLGRIVLLLALAAPLIVGCSQPATVNVPTATPVATATATPDEFAATWVIFARECTVCHGGDGKGGLVTIDNKKLKVPSLLEGHALKHSDEDFVDQISDGGDGMPKFKDKLSTDEINGLVHLIRHKFQEKK